MSKIHQQFLRVIALMIAVSVPSFAQTLTFSGTPALGSTVSFVTTGTPNGIYALAASNLPGPTLIPPLPPLAVGQPFAFLVGPNAFLPYLPALGPNGQAAVSIQIPVNFQLFGQTWYFQSVYADPASPVFLTLTNGVSFTVANPALAPTISTVMPSSGGASGGTAITITGTNFVPGSTTVTLGGYPLGNLQVTSATTITGTTPGGTAGSSVSLQVSTTAGGFATLASAFTYLPEPPTITTITPDHCQIGGGSLITITGTGLGVGTSIYLGGSFLTPITQASTQFVAFAPAFSQLGFVGLIALSPLGSTYLPNALRYTIPLDTGTGADGAYNPSASVTLDTTLRPSGFDFTEMSIPSGTTVTVVGAFPLRIRCRSQVSIDGTIDLRGQTGGITAPGVGGPGGYVGGIRGIIGNTGQSGPGYLYFCYGGQGNSAAYGTLPQPSIQLQFGAAIIGVTYGTADLIPLVGGSGGAGTCDPSGSCGGGGGGALEIAASEDIWISGMILATGGHGSVAPPPNPTYYGGGGSGGAIRLVTQGRVLVTGTMDLQGGSGGLVFFVPCGGSQPPSCVTGAATNGRGGNGRWFIENWLGQTASGTTATVPVGVY